MPDSTNHVLTAIDNAVQDFELSADAMRWAPDGAVTLAPPKALQRPFDRRPPRYPEPVRWEQRRTTCALAEIEAWIAEDHELMRHGFTSADLDALPPYSITIHRQHPPCIGCGRPAGAPFENALTVDGRNQPRMTATFQPCGCQLAVSVPAILDELPPGTRPERYAGQVIAGELFVDGEGDRVVERVKTQILKANEQQPHVVMLLDAGDPLLEQCRSVQCWISPGDKAVVAFWLRVDPGATEYVVYRSSPEMPQGDMPADLEGRWEQRASIPNGAVPDRRFVLVSRESFSTATARSTGRVEISPEGAVAEVYEVRPDCLP